MVGVAQGQQRLAQLLLGLLPVGDVHADADQPLRRRRGLADQLPERLQPADLAVGPDDPVAHVVVVGAFLDDAGDGRENARAVLGMDVALVISNVALERSLAEPVDPLQHRRPGDLLRGDVPVPRAQPPRLERHA